VCACATLPTSGPAASCTHLGACPVRAGVAESWLANLGRVGFDDAGRTVEVLVALTYATLAIAVPLDTNTDGGLP
jgi:hypothetical protein